jgi:hypothetical protein
VDAASTIDAGDESALERVFGPQATSREALPEPRAWAARIAQAVEKPVEIAGDRHGEVRVVGPQRCVGAAPD